MATEEDKSTSGDNPRNTNLDDALAESQAADVTSVLEKNRNLILIGIVLVVGGILAVLILRQVSQQKHIDAGVAYSAAAADRDIAALDGVVVNHPGSVGAGNALLTKADVQIDQGKAKDAQTTLETFNNDFKGHPRYAQGLFALANLHHSAGAGDLAKPLYEKAIESEEDGELTPLARIRLGDLALEANDNDMAEQNYQDAIVKHPGTPFVRMAEEKIELLKVGNPPVVDAPKPPPPPPAPKKEEESKEQEPAAKGDNSPASPKSEPAKQADGKEKGNATDAKKPGAAPGPVTAPKKGKAAPQPNPKKGKNKAKAKAKSPQPPSSTPGASKQNSAAAKKGKERVKKAVEKAKQAVDKAKEAVKEVNE